MKKIVEQYVLSDSKNEVNISVTTKEFVVSNYTKQKQNDEKWILDITAEDLFFKIYYSVYEELRQDSFHRFVRTKLCDEAIRSFRNDPTVVSPYITKQFDYKDDDFTTGIVTDTDFEFGKLLSDDSFTWEIVPGTQKYLVNAYYSDLNYLPDLSIKTIASKYECTLPISFQKALLTFLCDESILSDPNAAWINCLEYIKTEDLIDHFKKNNLEHQMEKCKRSILRTSCEAVFGFPFNMRLITQAISLHYEPETKCLYGVFKPHLDDFSKFCEFEKMSLMQKGKNKRKNVKAMNMFDFTVRKFQYLDDHKTIYQEITITQLGGWVSSEKIGKMLIKERAMGLRKSVLKCCGRFSDDVKISDFEEKFNVVDKNFKPTDMYGKLLLDLEIEKMDKEYQNSLKTSWK
eukprot:gene3988-7244_t